MKYSETLELDAMADIIDLCRANNFIWSIKPENCGDSIDSDWYIVVSDVVTKVLDGVTNRVLGSFASALEAKYWLQGYLTGFDVAQGKI